MTFLRGFVLGVGVAVAAIGWGLGRIDKATTWGGEPWA